MSNKITLNNLPIGKSGRVFKIIAEETIRRRLLDLGLIKDTFVKSLHISPAGDPIAYEIRDAVIALRKEEAKTILIEIEGDK